MGFGRSGIVQPIFDALGVVIAVFSLVIHRQSMSTNTGDNGLGWWCG